jgi:hypothetical protein
MLERTKVDAYMALKAEQKRLETAIKEMEQTLLEDMVASGMDKAEGTDGYVRLQVVEDKVMPAKDAYLRKGYSYLRVYR